MSWTDVFPVLTEEQVIEFQNHADPGELAELEEWFGVKETINRREAQHVVSASLFWKNCNPWQPELPPITREWMMNAVELGLVSRYSPWDHYVQPLLDCAAILAEERPDVVFRVYLAADLEFLIPDLVAAGCEVKLMKSSSIRHNPGAMWRFLAFEATDQWVTITDSDLARDILGSVERTELVMKGGLGHWRRPYIFGSVNSDNHPGYYRPINASQFGGMGGEDIGLLMKAFLWHARRGTMPDQCLVKSGGKKGKLPIFGTEWPMYGFDEWFLTAALYPRMAFGGVMTFLEINHKKVNHWFAQDIEYVTWANPKSEILYFGEPDLLKREKMKKAGKPAKSAVLEEMLAAKRDCGKVVEMPRPRRENQTPATLVIARYREDLTWLLEVGKDVTLVVYNKGEAITDTRLLGRIDHLEALPNRGRESDTYLHHVANYGHGADHEWTIFCQGDPFYHSPDFLRLLDHRDEWQDVQPLTAGYNENLPPAFMRELVTDEWIAGIPVRSDLLSAGTLRMSAWRDLSGEGFVQEYVDHYQVPPGWSITGHFLEACGWKDLAEQAWRATLVRAVYAAIFAVRNNRLAFIPRNRLGKMQKLASDHRSMPYVYERLWLHLFGLPFITLGQVEKGTQKQELEVVS